MNLLSNITKYYLIRNTFYESYSSEHLDVLRTILELINKDSGPRIRTHKVGPYWYYLISPILIGLLISTI